VDDLLMVILMGYLSGLYMVYKLCVVGFRTIVYIWWAWLIYMVYGDFHGEFNGDFNWLSMIYIRTNMVT